MIVGVKKSTAQKMFREDYEEKITDLRSFLHGLKSSNSTEATKQIVAASLKKSLLESKKIYELAMDSKSNSASGKEELRKISEYIGQSAATILQISTFDELSESTFIDLANIMGTRNIWIEPAQSADAADATWRCTVNYAPTYSGAVIFIGRCDLVLKSTISKGSLYQVNFDGIASSDKPDQAVAGACKRSMRK